MDQLPPLPPGNGGALAGFFSPRLTKKGTRLNPPLCLKKKKRKEKEKK